MELKSLVKEILSNAAIGNKEEAYKDVYFIKPINPGDRINFFLSFRWKSSKNEVFICTTEINLEKVERNVYVSICLLKPKERISTTFFKKYLTIGHKGILEILTDDITSIFVDKLKKVEDYYVNN